MLPHSINKEIEGRIIELFNNGETQVSIAIIIGCAERTIFSHLKKLNLTKIKPKYSVEKDTEDKIVDLYVNKKYKINNIRNPKSVKKWGKIKKYS